MAKTDNMESITEELMGIKTVVAELKSELVNREDSTNHFNSIMKALEEISTYFNNSGDDIAFSKNYEGLYENVLELKNELSKMSNNIDKVINTQLGELILKLTEKVNRLEILTNNTGIDQSIIADAAAQLEKTVKAVSADMEENISNDITVLGSNIDKTADNLKRSIIDIFTRIQTMVAGVDTSENSDWYENIEMLKTGMYNLNVNTEQRFSKLNKTIEELELFSKLQNFANLKNLPAIGDLKNALNIKLSEITDEYSILIQKTKNKDELSMITKDFRKNVYEALIYMLSNVSEYVLDKVDSYDNNSGGADIEAIKELRNSISEVKSKIELNKSKELELSEVIRESTKSIIESSEPDRFAIKELLNDIKKNISLLQSGDEESDYTYSMQDIEADVAKIRIYLNELAQNGLSVDADDLKDELNSIVLVVDSIKQQLNKIDECDIADTLSRIQDDITSVSTRINKLLLTSDNSYNMVECTLKEFKLLSDEINSQIKTMSATNRFKSLEDSLASLRAALVESSNYNSVINQSLIMLAEWVDNAGELLTNISEKQDKFSAVEELNSLFEETKTSVSESSASVIASVKALFEETNSLISDSKPVDYSTVLNVLDGKINEQRVLIEQQEERLNKLDEKLSTILEFAAKNDSSQLASKLVEIDEKMEKLNINIEKITSFINED